MSNTEKSVPEQFGMSDSLELNAVSGSIKQGMKSIGSSNEMFMVSPLKLRIIPGFNTRIKDERYWAGVKELAESIRENGFYKDKPLACFVTKEGNETVVNVVEGGRRYDAAMMRMEWMTSEEASEFRIPAVAKPRETSEVDMVYGMAQGNNAVPFRPYEMAVLVKRLKQVYSQTDEQILAKLGGMVSPTHLTNLLIVAGAPRKIAELVISEKLSVTQAAKIMIQHGSNAIDLIEKAEANAKAEGKEKITDRFMPGKRLEKAVRKEATALYESAKQVMNDPGFRNLNEETQAYLRDLMADLKQAEDPVADSTANDDDIEGHQSVAQQA